MYLDLLIKVILLSLLSAFIIIFITKVGFREYMQVHGSKFISELFCCDFCLCFWVSMGLSIIFCIFVPIELTAILLPVMATPITRLML